MKKQRYAFIISALSALLLSGCVYSHVSSSNVSESSSRVASEVSSSDLDNKDLSKLFTVLNPTDNEFRGVTNPSGNTWAIFTPTANGIISGTSTINDINFDTFFSIYDLTDLKDDFDRLGDASKDAIYYSFNTPASFSDISVIKDHKYVIKYGALPCQDNYIDTISRLKEYADKELSYSFSYISGGYKTYSGDYGDLKAFFTDKGEFVHAFLGTKEITDVKYEDGSIVYLDYESMTCDVARVLNPQRKIPRTVYKLNDNDSTYVKKNDFAYEDVFVTLDENSTEFSGFTGNDGNIWAFFTSSIEGFISLREIGDGIKDLYSYITIYDKGGALQPDNYQTTASNNALATSKTEKPATITDLHIKANHTYVIKAGYGPFYSYDGINPVGKHVKENFSIVFNAPKTIKYTGSEGDIYLKTYNTNQLLGFSIDNNGQTINYRDATISEDGRVVTVVREYIDSSRRLDPNKVITTKNYIFDFDNQTYTVSEENEYTPYFYEIRNNVVEYEAELSEDLNIYAKFTALNNGIAVIDEAICPSPARGYISVFDVTDEDKSLQTCCGKTPTGENGMVGFLNCSSENSRLYVDFYMGHTYVIKVGLEPKYTPYSYNEDNNYKKYKGGIERMRFEFLASQSLSFLDDENNLLQITSDGYLLNSEPIDVTVSNNGLTLTHVSEKTFDEDSELTVVWTKTIYNLDLVEHTFMATAIKHSVNLIQGVFDALPITCYASTSPNGSAIIKFVSPKTGIITAKMTPPNEAYRFLVFTDKMCTTLATGTGYSSYSSSEKTFCVYEGQSYYIRAAEFFAMNRDLKDFSIDSSCVGKLLSFSIY